MKETNIQLLCSAVLFSMPYVNYKYTNTAGLKKGYTIQTKTDIDTPVGEPVWPSGKVLGWQAD